MRYDEILTALFEHIETITTLPPVYYANRQSSVAPSDTHIRVDVIPAPTDPVTYDSDQVSGILQMSVYFRGNNAGPIAPARVASDIISLFPRNTIVGSLRFDEPGNISPAFNDDPWYVIPVSLYYKTISK